jgi:hypothetical protein
MNSFNHTPSIPAEYLNGLTVAEGSPGLTLDEVAHATILGRGRNSQGEISSRTRARVDVGALVFAQYDLPGNFVMSGGKSPGDPNSTLWAPEHDAYPEYNGETFQGKPEAFGMDERLDEISEELELMFEGRAVPVDRRNLDPYSLDTVTNITQIEAGDLYGDNDERPTLYVAQAAHLERIMKIASKVARRPYLGVVVPEAANDIDSDSLAAKLVTGAILLGVSERRMDPQRALDVTHKRATNIWRTLQAAQKMAGKKDFTYQTE